MVTSLDFYAQFQEINAGVGYAYYYGDLNVTKSSSSAFSLFSEGVNTKNFKMSYSLGYRYNFKNYFSVGLNFYHLYLCGYDSDNDATNNPADGAYQRRFRNLSFHTAVNEGFVDFRFEPLRTDKRWSKKSLHVSPYVGGGIGFFKFNPKTMYNGQEIELQPLGTEGQGLAGYGQKYSLFQMVVPISAGVKITPSNRRYSISLDFNYNFTFTDYLDDVSTVYAKQSDFQAAYQTADPSKYALVSALADRSAAKNAPGDKRGGSQNDDFFLTGQIKFSYYLSNTSKDSYYKCCSF